MKTSRRSATLGCRVSRKLSDGNFGSFEVSHEFSVDVEFGDPSELPEKAKRLRAMVTKAVEEGLRERQSKPPVPKNGEVAATQVTQAKRSCS